SDLIQAGARLHQAGCNGCIGMGQAPATGRNSLRTVPRNFPGRSGTREDSVYLCSPETATASALAGVITDPRTLDMPYPRIREPGPRTVSAQVLVPPPQAEEGRKIDLLKGPNIESLPELEPLPDTLDVPVVLKVGDDISTDEILPAGSRVLPYRSNIPRIAEFSFEAVDPDYPERAKAASGEAGHAVVGGSNYGQGSSREHAALGPRYLGLRVVLVKSFARIHLQNLVNFGVLPLVFEDPADYDRIEQDNTLHIEGVHERLGSLEPFTVRVSPGDHTLLARSPISQREASVLRTGGLTNWIRQRVRANERTAGVRPRGRVEFPSD
ncbi:MAG: aconitase family protein, partial [Longimicrobiales bacterium]